MFENKSQYAYNRDEKGNNRFLRAAKAGDLSEIKRLVADGFQNISDVNNDGYNAYLLACLEGHVNVVQYFHESKSLSNYF